MKEHLRKVGMDIFLLDLSWCFCFLNYLKQLLKTYLFHILEKRGVNKTL